METEAAQPEEGPKTTQTKKPAMEINIPKKHQAEKTEKTQAGGDKKSRPRPRYTDKARKNKKDKAKATETPNGEEKPEEGDKENLNMHTEKEESTLTDDTVNVSRTMNTPEDTGSALEHDGLPKDEEEEEEEEDEGENWDSLFNDAGDCLDPHSMEDVRVTIQPLFLSERSL